MASLLHVTIFFALVVGSLAQDFRDTSVQAHNAYRAKHRTPGVTRDPKIDAVAQKWADYLARNNRFEHSRGSGYGENLYMSYGGSTDKNTRARAAVKSWYDEIKDYDYNNPGFSMKTGHFTQVVWKGSTRIGTGIATVKDPNWGSKTIVVVNYDPPGNYQGQFPQNVLRPA